MNLRQEVAVTITQAETLPWDLVARPCGRRGQGKQPSRREDGAGHRSCHFTDEETKAETDLTVREQGHSSATAPSPFPLHPGGASQRPQGSRAGSPYLGPVACSLPACRPTGVLRPGPRNAAASGEAVSVPWAASPAHHAARLGPHAYLIMSIIPVLSPERSLSS